MNTNLFSDKQVMDLMNDDNNSQDRDHQKHRLGDNGLESKKEAIYPSYDFHPIRPNTSVGLSHQALDLAGSVNSTAARVLWTAPVPKIVSTSNARSYGSMDSLEPSKLFTDKNRNAPESEIISAIDRTIKAHTDNLLHVMEGVSARLTQLETRTRNLENLVDDVKISVGNSNGKTDGKMRQLENIMLEVQSGVQLIKDKQEIVEAQLLLSKLQVSKVNQQLETQSTHVEPTAQPPVSLAQPPASSTAPPSLPQQSVPPQQYIQQPASQHPPPPSSQLSQLPNQFSPQQDSYFPPPGLTQQHQTNQPPYQSPPPPTQSLPQTPYQSPPPPTQSLQQPPYQSPPQQPQYPQQPPPQLQHPSGYNPEEPPYPQQSYPPRQPPSHPPPGSSPSQQYYNSPPTPPSLYDGPGPRSNSGFPSTYSPEPYPYNTPSAKPPHQSGSGSSNYPQLAMARPLPQGLPLASTISSGGSGSPRSGNRAPVDDVIDKVVTMGFPRDQVRGTVRTLTENGQAVDLNVVLDKLMNGDRGGAMTQQQQQRGWFSGR